MHAKLEGGAECLDVHRCNAISFSLIIRSALLIFDPTLIPALDKTWPSDS